MVSLAAKLVRAVTYGMLIGVLMAFLFFGGASFLAMLGVDLGAQPTAFGLLGFVFGFAAPVAIEFSKDISEEKKQS